MVRPGLTVRVAAGPLTTPATASQKLRSSRSRSPPPPEAAENRRGASISPILHLPAGAPSKKPTPPPKDDRSWSPASGVSSPPSDTRLLGSSPELSSTAGRGHRESPAAAGQSRAEVLLREAWRPAWLRRRVLGGLAGVLAVLVVAAELVAYFEDGESADMGVEGVWTFGPVIVVSVLMALWSRVEFQALSYTPWMVLNRQPGAPLRAKRQDASKTLLLDYIGMGYVRGLYTATRNHHYLAAASIVTSLLLRLQIVLSTGIFRVELGDEGSRSLVVNPGNAHAMAAIFGLLSVVVLLMLPRAPTEVGITPRDPTTIAGAAVLFANSPVLLSQLRDCATKEVSEIADKLRGPWAGSLVRKAGKKPRESYVYQYQIRPFEADSPLPAAKTKKQKGSQRKSSPPYRPWTLRLSASITSIAVSAALLCGLWVLYEAKGGDESFDAVGSRYFLWTSLVTLVFVSLAFYLSCRDIDARRLAPYTKLATRECQFQESLGLAYTNELSLTTIFKSLRYRDWGVFLTAWLAVFGWLMPIFSAGLFAATRVEQEVQTELRQETYFNADGGSAAMQSDDELARATLIQDTPEFPAWTYEDLAFPVLRPSASNEQWASSTKRLRATATATRAILDCEGVSFANGDGLELDCGPLNEATGSFKRCRDGQSYLGYVASSCPRLSKNASFNYIWGDCSDDGTVTALMCNETIVDVDTDVVLVGDTLTTDLRFDNAPSPKDETQRPSSITLEASNAYNMLQNTSIAANQETAGLDPFFSALVQSRLDIDLRRLGTSSRTNSVLQAIKSQHGLLRAQALHSAPIRTPYAPSTPPPPTPIRTTLPAFTTQVRQSAPQTFALTALLGLTTLFSAAGLARSARGPPLPKSPGSIAAQASLVADSTMWARLPAGAEWASDQRLARRLRRATFRMGWFDGAGGAPGERRPGRSYTVGVVQDERRVSRAELEGDLGEAHMPAIVERPEK